MTADDLKDLEDLVNSRGWALLSAWVDTEWGATGFGAKVARSLADANLPDAEKVKQLAQARVAQVAVEGVMRWPAAQLAAAVDRAKQAAMPLPRRGTL